MDNNLLNKFSYLIYAIANKFYNIDKEDLYQAGYIGLINAYKNYDKNSNAKFSTYAYQYIYGEMYNVAMNTNTIKQSKDNLKLIKLCEKTRDYLTQKMDKNPTLSDIANYLEIDENTINRVYLETGAILSLDKEEDDVNLYNYVKVDTDNDIKIDLENVIAGLSKEEQELIRYRYYNDLTQSETASILGISQVKVSRYEKKLLKKLETSLS